MSSTPRLGFPLITPGQAQKELFHNEALQMLDLLVAPVVEDVPSASLPTSPAPGACYLIADSPDGAWAGNAQRVAGFTSGGWRFVAPLEGMSAYVRSTGTRAVYRGGV